MRLDLGSGTRPAEGFTRLDIRADVGADIVDDASRLATIQDGSCEEIVASHLLEHFGRNQTVDILKLWRSKLTAEGTLRVDVPNIQGHIHSWVTGGITDSHLVNYLYGDQDHDHNYHRTGFTPNSLEKALRDAGFRDVKIRNLGLAMIAIAR